MRKENTNSLAHGGRTPLVYPIPTLSWRQLIENIFSCLSRRLWIFYAAGKYKWALLWCSNTRIIFFKQVIKRLALNLMSIIWRERCQLGYMCVHLKGGIKSFDECLSVCSSANWKWPPSASKCFHIIRISLALWCSSSAHCRQTMIALKLLLSPPNTLRSA